MMKALIVLLLIFLSSAGDEFNNLSKESFRNIGSIKNAVNIHFADFDKQLASSAADKSKLLVVYSVGGNPEVF